MQLRSSLKLLIVKARVGFVRLFGLLELLFRNHFRIFIDYTWFLTQVFREHGFEMPPKIDLFSENTLQLKSRLIVVVPFRDKWELTAKCLQSLKQQELPFAKLAIVLVNNGSVEQKTFEFMRGLFDGDLLHSVQYKQVQLEILDINEAFNFSKLCNSGASLLQPQPDDWLLFLNNDVELCDKRHFCYIASRISAAQKDSTNIGALGCTLLYPNSKVQHSFLAPGVKIVAAHPLAGMPWKKSLSWFRSDWKVPAVTGAFLMTPRMVFERVGGFDEALAFGHQDLDYCLKLQKLEMHIVTVTNAVAMHHESASRGRMFNRQETEAIYARWGRFLTCNPLYPSLISRWSQYPLPASQTETEFPWIAYL